jgi:circadian clock protein KaiB
MCGGWRTNLPLGARMQQRGNDSAASPSRKTSASPQESFVFELYVAGTMPRSIRAVRDVKKLCERLLKGRYALKVFDLSRQPHLAAERQILALPTLIKTKPTPLRRFIGDLSDSERLASSLALLSAPAEDR